MTVLVRKSLLAHVTSSSQQPGERGAGMASVSEAGILVEIPLSSSERPECAL